MGRSVRAKLLFTRPSQLADPVGIPTQCVLHHYAVNSELLQVRAHPDGSVTPCRMVGDEVFHVATIVNQLFGAERLDDLPDHRRIVTLIDQFAAQIRGTAVATRQCVERRHSDGPRIERLYARVPPGVTLL